VISVTATDTNDQLLSYAQRHGSAIGMGTMTDLAAPGKGIVAPTGNNGLSTVEGTSFATPLVSGAVVLLQQIYQSRFGVLPTVDQLTGWLELGGDPIHDPVTGITISRLDIPKAASLVPAKSVAPPASTPPTNQNTGSASQTGTWTSNTSATIPVSYVPAFSSNQSAPPMAAKQPDPSPSASPSPAPQANPPAQQNLISSAPTPSIQTQVFINGKPLGSLDPSQPSIMADLSQTRFDALVKAMSAWASQSGSGSTAAAAGTVSQVRVWTAASETPAGIATGIAYPTGRLTTHLSRHHHRFTR
jgi:type VI secretion system secreted protein VgrG